MSQPQRSEEREERIENEVIVDAYGPEERSLGCYHYLEENIEFPFAATCVAEREISPLALNEEVKVLGLAKESECEREMFVKIRRALIVPLSQLEPVPETDEETLQAIEDWHYWVRMGYQI